MVAKITFPGDLMNALNYHEQKVQKGKAEGLHAENFLLSMHQMSFHQKMERFSYQMALNTRAETKLMHISLNFDPSENLAKEELTEIAATYMQKIGFGDQPFLVYKHDDAGHPHIHILTTTIEENGNRIKTHNIGRDKSEKARTEIEIEFGLVKATDSDKKNLEKIKPVEAEKVIYGKSETKRAITNVLDAVIKRYNYASLAELNAVLKLSNVIADRGMEGGRIHKTNGLVYRVLDEQGNKVGVPIKASSIYSRPTLADLEKRYDDNQLKRQPFRKQLRSTIETLLARSGSLPELIQGLKKQKIDSALRRNEQGLLYGITFIDHTSKSVFNGSDLGKHLSAAAIQRQLTKSGNLEVSNSTSSWESTIEKTSTASKNQEQNAGKKERDLPEPLHQNEKMGESNRDKQHIRDADLLQQLLEPEKTSNYIPYELRKKKKKKKKPKL